MRLRHPPVLADPESEERFLECAPRAVARRRRTTVRGTSILRNDTRDECRDAKAERLAGLAVEECRGGEGAGDGECSGKPDDGAKAGDERLLASPLPGGEDRWVSIAARPGALGRGPGNGPQGEICKRVRGRRSSDPDRRRRLVTKAKTGDSQQAGDAGDSVIDAGSGAGMAAARTEAITVVVSGGDADGHSQAEDQHRKKEGRSRRSRRPQDGQTARSQRRRSSWADDERAFGAVAGRRVLA